MRANSYAVATIRYRLVRVLFKALSFFLICELRSEYSTSSTAPTLSDGEAEIGAEPAAGEVALTKL